MPGRKDLLFFLALSIIISYEIKNIITKNGNFIALKNISEKEIPLTFSSWNLEYDLNAYKAYDSIKVNNLNLSKIKNFFIKCRFDKYRIKIGFMNFNK
ncbi:SIMPL domain-containing protein [Borreliella lusitaniae]|uniref:SIMPL domain-containing protein n=1 Tax=Borreliella lusitaniae TaxID=100177 RepID=UPI0026491A55|nr:SIMPL domain-containing protein [Borreliella lusitaniae]WKC85160.1 SIMPL domain-containing protein [Borreliella lusitaniae]